MPSHNGKTAIVTGGGAGLGLAIVQQLLQEGANVTILEVSNDSLTSFIKNIGPKYTEQVLAIHGSVTDHEKVDEAFASTQTKFGSVDYVVNSCGVVDNLEPIGELDMDTWNRVIAINLTAPAMVTKLAVNSFLKHDIKGAIVNISSLAAIKGFIAGSAYTVSKSGLLALTKSTAAAYWQKGIRCNAILAGPMATNIGNNMMPSMEGIRLLKQTYPNVGQTTEGINKVEDVANLVSYLCSADSNVVNGAAVSADGGFSAFQ